jgi:glycosyltransferase involved in cell wall biosynthesis
MKVTFVLPYAGLQGGIKVIAIYAERLRRRGHSVTVVSTPPEVTLRSRIKALLYEGSFAASRAEPSHLSGLDVEHRLLDRIRDVHDDDVPDADVVVATYYTTARGVLGLSARKGAKAIFIQNYEVQPGKRNQRLDETWRMPMHKITISNWLVELARERFGDDSVSHVPNSVDLTQFNAPERCKSAVPTVGLLYNTFSLKGLDTSLRALKTMSSQLPSLHVVSFGAERPDFRQPLPRASEFHYQPPQNALRELYAKCDLWLCGSNVEGFHLPPLEAMACRCPVVSTRVGGPLDIIQEGINGYLVPVRDDSALAEQALRVLRLPEPQWRQMSDAALRTATRFTWDDATTLFERALEQAVSKRELQSLRAADRTAAATERT